MQDIQIGTIRVRAENLTPAQGQQLGERIAALLVAQLAQGDVARRDVGQLRARVNAQGCETVEQLAAQVVSAIVAAL
ncbi:MAG: hypothetical protein JOZ51_24740 [Chloroflexi bacterium]|nr:hypothetical protein [Chloroflexota bacterium]